MFFLVEPSTGVALPILAGRTQLYGRFTGTPDDGMIVDIAVRSVRKCRNEVFDEDSSDSGDVSFRRFLEKNGGADDKDVAQYIEQNDGVLREQCYCARHFAYKIGKYINLLERSRVDAARLRDEVLWAGLLPSCMTLLDWGRLN